MYFTDPPIIKDRKVSEKTKFSNRLALLLFFRSLISLLSLLYLFRLLQSLLRSYSNCFVGREFVDWLIQVKEVETRDEVTVLNCSRSLIR